MDNNYKQMIQRWFKFQQSTLKWMETERFLKPNLDLAKKRVQRENPRTSLEECLLLNHYFNCFLWRLEDKARDISAKDSTISAVKRKIDSANQLRNDQIDEMNLEFFRTVPLNKNAPLFTECPGSVFDRLSIVNLKVYHLEQKIMAPFSETSQKKEALIKFNQLVGQRADLIASLETMFELLIAGKMAFKPFFQMKMYNDPTFNPFLRSNELR